MCTGSRSRIRVLVRDESRMTTNVVLFYITYHNPSVGPFFAKLGSICGSYQPPLLLPMSFHGRAQARFSHQLVSAPSVRHSMGLHSSRSSADMLPIGMTGRCHSDIFLPSSAPTSTGYLRCPGTCNILQTACTRIHPSLPMVSFGPLATRFFASYHLVPAHSVPVTWCQLCDANAVESTLHVLGWCDNDMYKEIITRRFEQLMCHTGEVSEVIGQAILGVLKFVNRNLQTPLKPWFRVSVCNAVVCRI